MDTQTSLTLYVVELVELKAKQTEAPGSVLFRSNFSRNSFWVQNYNHIVKIALMVTQNN